MWFAIPIVTALIGWASVAIFMAAFNRQPSTATADECKKTIQLLACQPDLTPPN